MHTNAWRLKFIGKEDWVSPFTPVALTDDDNDRKQRARNPKLKCVS